MTYLELAEKLTEELVKLGYVPDTPPARGNAALTMVSTIEKAAADWEADAHSDGYADGQTDGYHDALADGGA